MKTSSGWFIGLHIFYKQKKPAAIRHWLSYIF